MGPIAIVLLLVATIGGRVTSAGAQIPVEVLALGSVAGPVRPDGVWTATVILPPTRPLVGRVDVAIRREAVSSRVNYRAALERFPRSGTTSFTTSFDLAGLFPDPEGRVTLPVPISTDPTSPFLTLARPGVYPVQIQLVGPGNTVAAEALTSLIRLPEVVDEPLRLALVLPLAGRVQLNSGGDPTLTPAGREDVTGRITALAQMPNVKVTIQASPATLDALSPVEAGSALDPSVDQLRTALAGRQLLGMPYVGFDARALGDEEITSQLAAGRDASRRLLGNQGTDQTWVVGASTNDELGASGPPIIDETLLEALAANSITRLVVPEGALEPLAPGLDSAAPFEVDSETGRIFQAAAVDRFLVDRLLAPGPPVNTISDLIGELAQIWLAQPDQVRGTVLLPSARWVPSTSAVATLLGALGAMSFLQPVTVDEFFEQVPPLNASTRGSTDAEPVIRALSAVDPASANLDYVRLVGQHRAELASLRKMIIGNAPDITRLQRQLLLTSSPDESTVAERDSVLSAVAVAVTTRRGAVRPLETTKASILSRRETIRLRVRRAGSVPIKVMVRVSGEKLEFPNGNTRVVELTEDLTFVDVAVKVRTSGRLLMRVEFLTPDGRLSVGTAAPQPVQIRSLAVSGLGLVLSISALACLGFWWVRDLRRGRRRRRVSAATRHPSAAITAH
jgi:hypothetical protein